MPKAAAKTAKDSKSDPIPAIVDELGALELELAPLKPKIARLELLKKALRANYADSPAAESFLAEGDRFAVAVGERGMESAVNNIKLFQSIGVKPFVSLAHFTLKALEGQIEPSVMLAVVTKEQTGTRTLKVVEKAA